MNIRKTEFWVITGVVLFVVFFLVQDAALVLSRSDVYVPHYYGSRFLEQGLSFDYLKHHTYPLLTYVLTAYLAFLLAALYIYPKLYLRHNFTGTIVMSLLVYLAMVIIFSVADTWYKGYMLVGFGYFFMKNLVLVMLLLGSFVLYVSVREAMLHYYRRNEGNVQAYEPAVKRELLVIGGIWLGILLVFVFSGEHDALMMAAFWFTMVPLAYFLYVLNRYVLLPEYELKGKAFWPYFIKLLSFSLLLSLPFVALFFVLIDDFEPGLFFVLWLGQLLLIGPLSWLVYRAGRKKHNQIATLKQELGQTTADLQFLRSQINPHFLFNALNTLYGTALQENSERTAQGIQMLGDMMRFMLHENHQHKILLAREVEYMRNYIELQSLRTSTSPNITIENRIEDVLAEKFISPMLLIPFVENAFKHGISLAHRSWIRTTLHYEQDKLYFDVYNSTHEKQEQDPEKDHSGVGLDNVRQRLTLLYPNKHELVIRETAEEFFVHLTLQL